MNEIGLYFGSFNPIHVGHLIIANHMATRTHLKEIWFVVSPQSPFKQDEDLVNQDHRLKMVQLATHDNERFNVCDIEFDLPKPNYTIHTLKELKKQFPDKRFSIIMGEDNLIDLPQWLGYEEILENHKILVYPRNLKNQEGQRLTQSNLPAELKNGNIEICDAPLLMISSTFVRESILNKKDVRYLIPDSVIQFISNNFYYEKN